MECLPNTLFGAPEVIPLQSSFGEIEQPLPSVAPSMPAPL
jgi:hypothetical protein